MSATSTTTRLGTSPAPPAPRDAAVIAGISTLGMAVAGMFANIAVTGLAGSDAAGTAARVAEGVLLLRAAVLAFVVVAVLDVLMAWAIVRYFGSTQRDLALLAGWLRVTYTAVLVVAVSRLGSALRDATEPGWGDAASVHRALGDFTVTWQLGLLLFAAHLAVLAILLVRTTSTPTVIGVIIAAAAVGYTLDGVARVLLPADSPAFAVLMVIVAVPSAVGEIWLGLWFLLRGGRRR